MVGAARSGTTLLHQMLDHHASFALPYESKYIVEFAKNLHRFGDLGKAENRKRLILAIENFMRVAWYERDHEEWIPGLAAAADELAEKAEPSYAGVIDAMYQYFAAQQNKPRWGDKMAGFRRCLPILDEMFPNAKFIHIIRDGRDVASSILPMSFGPNTIYVAAKKWSYFVQHGREFARQHPGKVYTIRYEDLIDEPEKYLREICDFIGEPFDPAMLEFHKDGTARVPRKEIHGQLTKPVNKQRQGRWKKDLTADQIRVFEAVAGKLLAELGYEVTDPSAQLRLLDKIKGKVGHKLLFWRPFTRPVGLWDRIKMKVGRKGLERYDLD